MRNPEPCTICSEATKYTCVDCIIDGKGRVFVCTKDECRNKHRKEECTAATNNSQYKYAFNS